VAIDAEFGLRVRDVGVTEAGNVRINLDNGHVVIFELLHHLVPRAERV
jgi:uncharacterized protein involved in outer membrane biogenesis